MVLAFGICALGVQKGVERITKIMMLALLALIIVIYLKGYWDMFAPQAASAGNPMLLLGWMLVAAAFPALIGWFAFGGKKHKD